MKNTDTLNNSLETGYFARANEGGQTGKWSKVHLISYHGPLCGYKPHATMKFQRNAIGAHLPYVECDKCKKELQYQFVIDTYSESAKDYYQANYYKSTFGISLVDIVKDANKRFLSYHEAANWAKRSVRLYRTFNKQISAGEFIYDVPKNHKIEDLLQDKKLLHDRVQDRLDLELKRQKTSGKKFISDEAIDSLIDSIIKSEIK